MERDQSPDCGSLRCSGTSDLFRDPDLRPRALSGSSSGVRRVRAEVAQGKSRKVSRDVEASAFLHLGTGNEARQAALALSDLRATPPYWESHPGEVPRPVGSAWRHLEFRLFADRRGQEFIRVQSVRSQVLPEGP